MSVKGPHLEAAAPSVGLSSRTNLIGLAGLASLTDLTGRTGLISLPSLTESDWSD